MGKRLLLYSDGGARGNPGPSAIAYLALTEQGETIKAYSNFIGTHTNNQSEYKALIAAIEFVATLEVEEVLCHLDSELVVKQLNCQYTVRNLELRNLWRKVNELKTCFKKVSFVNVPRSNPQITIADSLVNKALDQEARKRM